MTFSAVWAVQSRISSIALLSLVALSHTYLAIAVMGVWSLAATLLYFIARLHGAPDLLEVGMSKAEKRTARSSLIDVVSLAFRIGLVGAPAFLYTRVLRLKAPGACIRRRVWHTVVLGIGLTLFGVTTTHHILRKSGLSGDGLLRASCLGSVLNVGYRVAGTAMFLAFLSYIIGFARYV